MVIKSNFINIIIYSQRPWAQFDSNFQIMFKVGMGETPEAPESLSQEGHEFLEKALQHDPKNRATAAELLQHHFCKVITSIIFTLANTI